MPMIVSLVATLIPDFDSWRLCFPKTSLKISSVVPVSGPEITNITSFLLSYLSNEFHFFSPLQILDMHYLLIVKSLMSLLPASWVQVWSNWGRVVPVLRLNILALLGHHLVQVLLHQGWFIEVFLLDPLVNFRVVQHLLPSLPYGASATSCNVLAA